MSADLFAQQFGNQSPQNAYFKKLLEQGLDTTPIQSPWQGASRMAMALLAGLDLRDQDQQEKASQALRMNLPGLGPQPTQPAQSGGLVDALAKPAPEGGPDMSLPRGIRNNNPLNIEAGDFTKGQPGFTGSDGRFARFGSMDQGTAAASKLLDTYQNKYGLNTVGGIVNRWAPPGENDSRGYAASVAGRMGISPDQPLTPDQRPALIAAMGQFENGRPIPQQADATLPPNATLAQGKIPTVPQATPTVTPTPGAAAPQRSPVQIDPQMAQQIRTMIGSKDPAIQQQGYVLYQQFAKPREETRPLTNPQDRARYGIAPTDSNPYQVDSKGEVKAINPQPFAVNVNQQGQSEFEKHYGEGQAKSALATLDRGNAAVDKLQKIELTQSLLQKVQTGKLAPAQATISAWAEAIGMKPETLKSLGIDPNMAMASQAAQGLMAQQTISMIGQGGFPANNFSDADRKFLQQIPGSISNVQGANEIAGEIGRRVAQRDIDKANAWADARGNGIGYEKFERDWRKKVAGENMFADLQQKIGESNGRLGGSTPAQPAQGDVRRFNPATGKIE